MENKDIIQLCHNIDDARTKLHTLAWAIVDYHWDEIKRFLSQETRNNYQRLSLAKQAADRDLNECLSVAAEAASFKD